MLDSLMLILWNLRLSVRIFRIFHPGVFMIIHPPPSFDFRFLPTFLLPSNGGSFHLFKGTGSPRSPYQELEPEGGRRSRTRSEARAERREAGSILDGRPSEGYLPLIWFPVQKGLGPSDLEKNRIPKLLVAFFHAPSWFGSWLSARFPVDPGAARLR